MGCGCSGNNARMPTVTSNEVEAMQAGGGLPDRYMVCSDENLCNNFKYYVEARMYQRQNGGKLTEIR